MSLGQQYTPFQIFALIHLIVEEQKLEERGEAFGQRSPTGMPISHRYITSINDLSIKAPPSFMPDQPSGKEILIIVKNQIDKLKNDGLLENDRQFSDNREHEDQGFYVTAAGRLFVRKHYTGLIPVVDNKQEYEQIIDQLEVDSDSNKSLKKLRDKLIGKTEDKIIDTINLEIIKK
jgi:hypothetical protein